MQRRVDDMRHTQLPMSPGTVRRPIVLDDGARARSLGPAQHATA